MLLILSNSKDVTTDIIVKRLGDIPLLRFDIDKWRDYSWEIGPEGFSITHPDGTVCHEGNLRGVYLRKMMYFNPIDVPAAGCLENWCREEVQHLWRDLMASWHARGLMILVHPGKGRWDKIRQMREAAKYFKVPRWSVCHGKLNTSLREPVVMKTLTQTTIGEGKVMLVREVEPEKLDPQYPWFLQEKVHADADVTVLYVRGKLFAFALDRASFEGDDYRMIQTYQDLRWQPLALSASEQHGMRALMETMGLDFGRFDFLRRDGELWFLELNPNGQWAWLDDYSEVNLVDLVCEELRRAVV